MKEFNLYIQEKLKINSSSKISNYDYVAKNKVDLYNYINPIIHKNNNANLNNIDVSNITDMSDLFSGFGVSVGHIDISKWNVSNVENMSGIFLDCINFDCDLSKWDVSNVKDMSYMFSGTNINGKSIENWDVSNVEDMKLMFSECNNLNCDLSKWDVSNVENMKWMFSYSKNSYIKGLDNWKLNEKCNYHSMFSKSSITIPKWYKK